MEKTKTCARREHGADSEAEVKRLSIPDSVWKFLLEYWPIACAEREIMARDLTIKVGSARYPVEVWL